MSRRKQKVLLDTFEVGEHVLRPGQQVMLRPPQKGAQPYIARIEHIERQTSGGGSSPVMLVCRWYYRPEESLGGRRLFHGSKEVFLSDHVDRCYPESVEGECKVHTLRSYTALRTVGPDDFFCRFQYNATTGLLSPDKVAVYCICEMPFNPDSPMLFCTQCQDLFHPECVGLPPRTSKSNKTKGASTCVEKFVCPTCCQSKDKTGETGSTKKQKDRPREEDKNGEGVDKKPEAKKRKEDHFATKRRGGKEVEAS